MHSLKDNHILASTMVAGWLALSSNPLLAAQGDGRLATEPLFLAPPEPPNIMLLLDSTGSMSRTLAGGSVSSNPLKQLINPSRMTVLKNVFLGRNVPTDLNCSAKAQQCNNSGCRDVFILNSTEREQCQAIVAEGNTDGLFDEGVFDNSRVGLAEFFSNNCSSTVCTPKIKFLVDIDDIERNLRELKTDLKGIQPGGATPLAVALQTMGLYFSQNAADNLTLHPGTDDEITLPRTTIFKNTRVTFTPSPAPISTTHFCATNHVVLLTDGQPFRDAALSKGSGLRNYDGNAANCESGNPNNRTFICGNNGLNKDNLDDVALALKEIDMRPDVEGVNNIITHVVGFGNDVLNLSILTDAVKHSGGDLKNATSAPQLKSAFEAIAAKAIQADATAASATFNASTLNTGSIAFRTEFTSGIWNGEISAHTINDTTGAVNLECTTTNPNTCWQASKVLAARTSARNIFTLSNTGTGIAFTTKNQTAFQQALQDDLNSNAQADSLINYIRGDRASEGTLFRTRGSALGDIINSEAVFHNGVLYVGANDGMLHAFSATTGEELFAYIPGGVASTQDQAGLHYLASKNYIHRPYVDLTPTIARVGDQDILIGGYGAGAKGLFALNITTPSNFSGRDVLWELTPQDVINVTQGDHLGFLLHKPVVATIDGVQRIIFGNGYQSTSGLAKLLHIDAAGPGSDKRWSSAAELSLIDAGSLTNNGLGGVNVEPVIRNGNPTDEVAIVYAGTLQGNLWSFLGDNPPHLAFQAGNDQPITAPPVAKPHQVVEGVLQYQVFFGSGAFFATGDNENSDIQSYYSIIDNQTDTLTSTNLRRVNIQEVASQAKTTRITTQAEADDDALFSGWFLDLPTAFERSILESTLFDSNNVNVIIFATTIPEAAKDDNGNPIACASGGSGFVMVLDQTTGLSPTVPVFDLNGDLKVDSNDLVGGEVPSGFQVDDLPTSPRILKRDKQTDPNSQDANEFDDSELFINTSGGVDETLLQTRRRVTGANNPTLERLNWREIRSN